MTKATQLGSPATLLSTKTNLVNRFKNIEITFNITDHCSIKSDHQKGGKIKENKKTESITKSDKRN
jgi:hypothetical protein